MEYNPFAAVLASVKYSDHPEQVIRRLRGIIEAARLDGTVPGDPDCVCGGWAEGYDDEGSVYRCACVGADGLDAYRKAYDARQVAENERVEELSRQWWRDNHGHEKGEECRDTCPSAIPF